jgi:acetyltransferase-like isoleucine patch superfamily enzyme
MNITYLFQQSLFVMRFRYLKKVSNCIRTFCLKLAGMKVAEGTYLPKGTKVTWPHQVKLGNNCKLEHSIYFHFDGIYSEGPSICIGNNVFIGNNTEFNITDKIYVGDYCLIGAGSRFIDHNHGTAKEHLMRGQKAPKQEIIIEEDVWLGCNVVVLMGIKIGKGAIVAAGAIVNKNIPSYEIWGGVPAKKIGERK